ncbi:MAG: hypothetical protein LBF27_22620 [Sphingobacterium sp.]|jgi:hypothetical protein|nr:hypothetical protein [Sphingobacterium sp.]
MIKIKTTFLDTINYEEIDNSKVISLFQNLNLKDLAYSNTGYFQYEISDESDVILHFSIMDLENISLRYDENIPDRRNGLSWYSVNQTKQFKNIIDVGEENYIPNNSLLSPTKVISVIDEFFNAPLKKPMAINWKNSEDFDWE